MGHESTQIPETVRASELAALLGVTPSTVSHLATAGHLVKRGSRYALAESVARYCTYLRSPAARAGRVADAPADPLKAARIRFMEAQTARTELKAAREAGELLDRAAVEAAWRGILADVRAGLLAVPSRVGTRLPTLTAADLAEIAAEIRAALEALAAAPEAAQESDL